MRDNEIATEPTADPIAQARAKAKADLMKALLPLSQEMNATRAFNERMAELGVLATGKNPDLPCGDSGYAQVTVDP